MNHLRCIFFSLFFFSTTYVNADIAPENLPDLSALQNVLGKMSANGESYSVGGGPITSGIIAPHTGASGKTAAEVAAMLSGGSAKKEAALRRDFTQAVEDFENLLVSENFKSRDLGVALSAFFIMCWEMANDTELPPSGALNAGRQLTEAVAEIQSELRGFSAAEMDETYDALISTPLIFLVLTKALEKKGDIQAAEMIRRKSGELFNQVIGMDYRDVRISPTGSITIVSG